MKGGEHTNTCKALPAIMARSSAILLSNRGGDDDSNRSHPELLKK
jgi:hypothetical protein